MKKELLKYVLALIIGSAVTLCIGYSYNWYSDQKAIMTVGEEKITKGLFQEKLAKNYSATELTTLKEESIVNQHFKKLGLTISDADRLEQAAYLKLIYPKLNASDLKGSEKLNNYIKVKKSVEKMKLVSTTDLREFLDEERRINGGTLVSLTAVNGNHDDLSKMAKKVTKQTSLSEVAKLYKVKTKQLTVFSKNNEMNMDLSKVRIHQVVHYMPSQTSTTLFQVTNIKNVDDDVFNAKRNHNTVLNVFFSRNFESMRGKLINRIAGLYPVIE